MKTETRYAKWRRLHREDSRKRQRATMRVQRNLWWWKAVMKARYGDQN